MTEQMKTEEALLKIEEINSIIQSSNRALFSGRHMMLYGIIVLLIPLIGMATQWLTFGHDFGTLQGPYTAIANTMFFWALSVGLSKILPKSKSVREQNQHPLIQKAFSISRPIMFAVMGVVAVFSLIGLGWVIYPVVLILIGIQFSVFGTFTIKPVSYLAWSYIAAGLLLAYLHSFEIPNLTFYFLVYNGITYILMGVLLQKAELTHGK